MKTLRLHIKSFGCQMNKLDSGLVSSALTARGMVQTDKITDAHVILFNTCSVREHAEQRVLSNLGHLKHLRKSRPDVVVAVIGCMAQRIGSELIDHPAVDIVCGPTQIPLLPEMIEKTLAERQKQMAVSADIRAHIAPDVTSELDRFEYTYDTDANHIPGQAFVRAMRGCNNFCTYCIVPYVRGPEISRPADEIVEQVKKLADSGVRQITLLGQSVNAYHYVNASREYFLGDLLEKVSEVSGIEWVRFITSHPGKFDRSIFAAMADLDKVCPYLHIPAQSGSDIILKAMNRGYTRAYYLDLLEEAREKIQNLSIAGDFIVGFPGETQEDYEQTADLIRRARYKNCFIFKYSPRPGTLSEQKLQDTVPDTVKQARNIELLELQNRISEEDNRRFQGKILKVLVEGLSKKPHLDKANNQDNPQLIGRTAHDYIVVFNGPETLAGQFTDIQIVKTSALLLFGELAGK